MNKWVYTFGNGKAEGDASMRNLLGGKGANLAEMNKVGLPVPPGFTVTTEVCTYYYNNDHSYPADLKDQVREAVAYVEGIMGKKFADANNPLLFSVRSGARVSMPGMMDTVLNLGLNDETVKALAKASGSERFAYDSYRRFLQMFSDVVLGADLDLYEDVVYPVPETFYDKYEGRIAASEQEMNIIKDMDLVYDLKMADKENEIHTTTGLEENGRNLYNRMTPAQKAAWDKHYDPIIKKFKEQKLTGKALAEWKYQQYMHDYMRVIHSVDRNVGRVLDYMEKSGLLENTIIVYTSDQGFYMGEHGWFDKRFMYEESFRTPMLVRFPGGVKGDIPEMVQNIDHAATFLQVAGVPVPEDIQGASYLPLLKGEKPKDWRTSLYYHFYEYPAEHAVKRHYGVRTDRYKLIHFYNDIDVWELYDLQNDPMEMHNIYNEPGNEALIDSLKIELNKLQEQYDDPIETELATAKK